MKRQAFIVAAFLATSAAYAQGDAQQKVEQRFQTADANHDGKLTREEAQAGMPRLAAKFDQIDATHQGYITLAQLEQFAAKSRQ
jgi:Ca2+-binding EF-hand superfamily protein